MTDLRSSSSSPCSPPPLHSWTCAPADLQALRACSCSNCKEEREGSWKGGRSTWEPEGRRGEGSAELQQWRRLL